MFVGGARDKPKDRLGRRLIDFIKCYQESIYQHFLQSGSKNANSFPWKKAMGTRLSTNELTNTISGDRYFQQISHHFETGWPIMASTSRENLSAPRKSNRCYKYVTTGIKLKKYWSATLFLNISFYELLPFITLLPFLLKYVLMGIFLTKIHPPSKMMPFVPTLCFQKPKAPTKPKLCVLHFSNTGQDKTFFQKGRATHHKSMRQQSAPKTRWTRATNRLKTSRTG